MTRTQIFVALLVTFVGVLPVLAEDDRERNHLPCEKYCHTDCKSIPDQEHRDLCSQVHAHDSGCHCHFGGSVIGIFVVTVLAAVLLAMCCVCRHCKRREKRNTTNIVVVAQPETITTITQPGMETQSYTNSSQQQRIFTIEMSPHVQPRQYKQNELGDSGVTVITSKNLSQQVQQQNNSSLPSDRIYFDQETSQRINSEDFIFSPPRQS